MRVARAALAQCVAVMPTRGSEARLVQWVWGLVYSSASGVSTESLCIMCDLFQHHHTLHSGSRIRNLPSLLRWTFTRSRASLNALKHLQGTLGILKLVLIFSSQININASVPLYPSMAADLAKHKKKWVEVKSSWGRGDIFY